MIPGPGVALWTHYAMLRMGVSFILRRSVFRGMIVTKTLLQKVAFALLVFCTAEQLNGQSTDTLPPLISNHAPQNFMEMWAGFDPTAEPLETEILHEWEEDNVALQIVRFRIGVFKGQKATLAAVYGLPKGATDHSLPGLVQIHGGGQYADFKACLMNAKRGYATISIAWAGRINAPEYRVTPNEVKLFWDGKTDDPHYKLTTDWGAVDGYHAPSRNPGNVFPSAKAAEWTLDSVESPRNSGWFLCAVAARRALTFLEHQPAIDPNRLGVYGHSMGGKLTVMSAVDSRVKAAAPSCGGISDRTNASPLFQATIGDDVSLKEVSCPIIFLSPSNDFHGRIGDLPSAIAEIKSDDWRVTCSPHHNHQDTPEYEVATMLWFDQHLKHSFEFPQSPETQLSLNTDDGVPVFSVQPDRAKPILSVDVYYTQQGKPFEQPSDMQNTMHRFWHHVKPAESHGVWTGKLPLTSVDKPLWVYANVLYKLDESVSDAGYYYGEYTSDQFNLSSLLTKVDVAELEASGTKATRKSSLLIESFTGNWHHDWFSYRPTEWALSTHKLYAPAWRAPEEASLMIEVQASQPNQLVILIDDYAAIVDLKGGNKWQEVELTHDDFLNYSNEPLSTWSGVKRLKLSPAEHLRPPRGVSGDRRIVGKQWQGEAPQFRNLRWNIN